VPVHLSLQRVSASETDKTGRALHLNCRVRPPGVEVRIGAALVPSCTDPDKSIG
jgi:hypothetical protein